MTSNLPGLTIREPGFGFTLRMLDAGWISAEIRSDQYWALLQASYLSDAISELLDAIVRLIDGDRTARCSWYLEPGEYRWLFDRVDETVSFRVLGFRDAELAESDDAGTFVFETTVLLSRLADAVARQVRFRGPANDYLEAWGHKFPDRQLDNVERHSSSSSA